MAIVSLADGKWEDRGYFRWECPNSPNGCCEYDDEADPAWDECIHCGEPYERK